MQLRLAALLTVLSLAIPSWGGETKIAPKQNLKHQCDEARKRTAQGDTFQESLQAQCRAAWGMDCSQHDREQAEQLHQFLERLNQDGPHVGLPNPTEKQLIKTRSHYWL